MQSGFISRPYSDAQDRLLWRDQTCPACTQAHHELESVAVDIHLVELFMYHGFLHLFVGVAIFLFSLFNIVYLLICYYFIYNL